MEKALLHDRKFFNCLNLIYDRLHAFTFPWAFIGGANRLLQGSNLPANDVDIITTKSGISEIYKALEEFKKEPLLHRENEHIRSWFAVFEFESIRIEVMAEVENKVDGNWLPHPEWEPFIVYIDFENLKLPCINLTYEIQLYDVLEMNEKSHFIRNMVREHVNLNKKDIAGFYRPTVSNPPKGTTWFLGIAVSEYINYPKLYNPVKDVEDIYDKTLRLEYDVQWFDIIKDDEVTQENVLNKLHELGTKTKEGVHDVIIYYSGHGYIDNENPEVGYWLPSAAKEGSVGSYIRDDTIINVIKTDLKNVRHLLLICDSCFSGNILLHKGSTKTLNIAGSRWGICSGRSTDPVYDGESGKNSPFALAIINTLRQNTNDLLNMDVFAKRVASCAEKIYRDNYPDISNPPKIQLKPLPIGNYINSESQFFFIKSIYLDEDIEWEECEKQKFNTKLYGSYIDKYGENGKHFKEAKKRYDELKNANCISQKTDFKLLNFIVSNSEIIRIPFINDRIKSLSEKLRKNPSAAFISTRDYLPVHNKIQKKTSIGLFPVTAKEYNNYLRDIGKPPLQDNTRVLSYCPVVDISFQEALNYCEWLSDISRKKIRLPTASEWEYAASGGYKSKGFTYAGSHELKEAAWFAGNARGKLHKVGKKLPNELGIYDMSGNVWEMCMPDGNVYDNDSDLPENAVCILRGGSFNSPSEECSIAYSKQQLATHSYNDTGFRIIIEH